MEGTRVYPPFYQVKVAGHVIDHTNNREQAHAQMRTAAALPAELWLIHDNGKAQLLDRIDQHAQRHE